MLRDHSLNGGLPSQQLLHPRPSQDFGRARGDAISPAMELLHGEAVNGRRLADVDLQPRSRSQAFDPAVLLQTRQAQPCRLRRAFLPRRRGAWVMPVFPVLVQNALKCPIVWTSPKTSACSLAAMASPSATTNGRGRAAVQGVESGFGARAVVTAIAITEASRVPVLRRFSQKVIPRRIEEHHAGAPAAPR